MPNSSRAGSRFPATKHPPTASLGMFVKIPSTEVCTIVASRGPDFVIVDAEHSPLGPRDIYRMVALYSAHGVPALVRVAGHDASAAQQCLDMGAAGILVPHVETAEQARRVMTPLVFPPGGTRGSGYASAAGLWGKVPGGRDEYIRAGNDDIVRIAMLEDESALEQLMAIAEVPGVDAVFIGSGDLSLSLGESPGSSRVGRLVDRAIATAVEIGIPVGTVARQPAVRKFSSMGCAYLTVGNDAGILMSGTDRALSEARAAAQPDDEQDEEGGRGVGA